MCIFPYKHEHTCCRKDGTLKVSVWKATFLCKWERISRGSSRIVRQAKGLLPKFQMGINLWISLLPHFREAGRSFRRSAQLWRGAAAKPGHHASLFGGVAETSASRCFSPLGNINRTITYIFRSNDKSHKSPLFTPNSFQPSGIWLQFYGQLKYLQGFFHLSLNWVRMTAVKELFHYSATIYLFLLWHIKRKQRWREVMNERRRNKRPQS